jgi:ABC-type lipoprotein export system ATPase subunit
MNVIAGRTRPEGGTVRFDGTDLAGIPAWRRARLGIARSFQLPLPFGGMTVRDNLRVPLEQRGEADALGRADALLAEFGLDRRADDPAGDLSQVELRKLELARAVAGNPRLLISDEAMAGLSGAEIDEVLDLLMRLNARGIAVVMIEHMMRHHALFTARGVPRPRTDHRGGFAGRGGRAYRGQEGLSRCLISRFPISRRDTARCASSTVCRSRFAQARRSRYSAPTATASPR